VLWAKTGAPMLLDLDEFSGLVEQIVGSGLFEDRATEDGRPFIQISKFHENQQGMQYQYEPVGEWTLTDAERKAPLERKRDRHGRWSDATTAGAVRGAVNGTTRGAVYGSTRGTTHGAAGRSEGEGEGEVEGEYEVEGEWEGEPATAHTAPDVVMLTDGEPVNWTSRIWGAWNLAFEGRSLVAPVARRCASQPRTGPALAGRRSSSSPRSSGGRTSGSRRSRTSPGSAMDPD